MQTFVPHPDLLRTAQVLDRQRLGKQRVEATQILMALSPNYTKKGWKNHPATKMWQGHTLGLVYYTVCIVEEWKSRRYMDSTESFLQGYFPNEFSFAKGIYKRKEHWGKLQSQKILPKWFGGLIHTTHRAALLAKMPEHYEQFGWVEEPEINYYWPTENGWMPASEQIIFGADV